MKTNFRTSEKELEILGLIHARVAMSRAELVELTGLSAGLISAVVRRLIASELVVESGLEPSKLGRRRVALKLCAGTSYTIGVEIGTFFLRVVINDLAGNVCHKVETRTILSDGFTRVMERCFKTIDQAVSDSGINKDAIAGIGIAHSGVVDSNQGVVLSFPRPGQMAEWRNVALREMVEEKYKVPCVVEDSVRMAALAEKQVGIAVELSDFVYIRIGMGIGSCIFIDGEPYRGAGGSAGEFGHMTVDENGPLCYCGNNGCLSALASCSAIILAVAGAIRKGVHSKIQEMVADDLDQINIEMILQAAVENDSLAFRVLNDAAVHIGVALADVVNLLNPSVVIFSGPLFQSNSQLMLDSIQRVIRQRALEKAANEVQLIVSTLGADAPALGAARFAASKSIAKLYAQKN
ncbi:MAG TPA: ROK family transcriptional regulator [Terriglobales bacterium]|jgi:predicted NBD/HSP70 family sugar kinase|nr:ROK family transcriptional regulator [Terriglobales bacterium]